MHRLLPSKWAACAVLFTLASCYSVAYRGHDPRYDDRAGADVSVEMSRLADELARKAERRTSLGAARVVIDDLVPLEPRVRRYRAAGVDAAATRDTEATLRHELEMALADYMNVVGGTIVGGAAADDLATRASRGDASHVLRGTYQRIGRDVEVTLQLVERRSEWLVATARHRIENFEPDAFDHPVVDLDRVHGRNTVQAEMTEPEQAVPLEEGVGPVVDPVVHPTEDPEAVPADGEIEFESGPAAARLRAIDPELLEAKELLQATPEQESNPEAAGEGAQEE